jgi:hypothetical protein
MNCESCQREFTPRTEEVGGGHMIELRHCDDCLAKKQAEYDGYPKPPQSSAAKMNKKEHKRD